MTSPTSALSKSSWHRGEHSCVQQLGHQVGIWHRQNRADAMAPECFSATQVHGTTIVPVDALPCEADGLYSQKPGERVMVRTADCLPVIIAASGFVMALHAGWRGLAAHILRAGLEQASQLGIASKDLSVDLLPCISLSRFEVGPEVVEALWATIETSVFAPFCLYKSHTDRWHVDLAMVAYVQLLELGLEPKRIAIDRRCTYKDSATFFSYRRTGRSMHYNQNWACI